MNLKLSKYQESVLKDMIKMNLYLVTTEGKNFSCWLEDKKGNKIKSINKQTASILFNGNYIIPVEDNSPYNIFKYSVSSKAIKLIINIK